MIAIPMPKLGLTMEEGTIQRWLKKPGDWVSAGEGLAEIETDKSTALVEAPAEGTLWRVRFPDQGDTAPIGEALAYLLEPGEEPPAEEPAGTPEGSAAAGPAEPESAPSTRTGVRRPMSPAARRLAEGLGLAPEEIEPDRRGIIHLAQVSACQENRIHGLRATPAARTAARDLGVDLAGLAADGSGRVRLAQVEAAGGSAPAEAGEAFSAFTGPRRVTALRMAQCKREVPHFYLSLSADMTRAKALMARQAGKVSLHDVLLRVLAVALDEHPRVNAHVREEGITLNGGIHIGVAAATDRGLMVPVVRNVRGKRLSQLAAESGALIQRARAGALGPDEYQGGTFTISNLGMFGIEDFAAIINQPEAAILAVGKTMETPVAVDGAVTIRPMVRLTASFDHRAVDGAEGARFLARVRELLEDPELLI